MTSGQLQMYVASLVVLILTLLGVLVFEGGRHWGQCEQRWSHAVTPIDTLRVVQKGCRLP